jgi:hypothetical protein
MYQYKYRNFQILSRHRQVYSTLYLCYPVQVVRWLTSSYPYEDSHTLVQYEYRYKYQVRIRETHVWYTSIVGSEPI